MTAAAQEQTDEEVTAQLERWRKEVETGPANGNGQEEWPSLDPAALYGLAGTVVRAIEPHTEADPAGLLLCFLAVAVGRSGLHLLSHAFELGRDLFVGLLLRRSRHRSINPSATAASSSSTGRGSSSPQSFTPCGPRTQYGTMPARTRVRPTSRTAARSASASRLM